MDLISVIVPVYNVEPYLERCVDSIRRQTYKSLEIILVDDGSPDRCGQMCDDYALKDHRIKVVHKENGGLGYARNSGLDVTTGTYVTFIDSDDWISEDHIENLYNSAKVSGADLAIGSHTRVSGSVKRVCRNRIKKTKYEGARIIEDVLLPLIGADVSSADDIQMESSSCMNLYSVSLIREYDLRFISERDVIAEDFFFNVDYIYHARCVVVTEETGYFYFHNPQSISWVYRPERFLRTIRYYHLIMEKTVNYGLRDRAEYRIGRSYLMKIRVAIRHIVNAEMPVERKLQEIREILNHEVTRKVLAEYPIHTFIPAMRLLAYLMKYRSAVGVYCLMKFREGIGRRGIAKKLLKAAGIGR